MACFFNRDDIALPGLAKYFRRSSDDERSHAQKLMDLQASRGGRVHLQAILAPDSDYKGEASGDALKAMARGLTPDGSRATHAADAPPPLMRRCSCSRCRSRSSTSAS